MSQAEDVTPDEDGTMRGFTDGSEQPASHALSEDDRADTGDVVVGGPGSGKTQTSGSRSPSGSRGLSRGSIRRIAVKAEEVAGADPRTREVAGSLLGSGTGVSELTTAIMSSPRGATAPVHDLNRIAAADQMDMAVEALALGRDRLKRVCTLLSSLGGGVKQKIPSGDAAAAKDVAHAVNELDDVVQAELETVVALLKKG